MKSKERKEKFMDENMIAGMEPAEVRTISFGDYEGLVVEHADPYRYESGKGRKVFRIRGSEDVFTHEVRDALKTNAETIYYYINGELKESYDGYSYDYTSAYHAGIYDIEIECVGELEERLLAAERKNQELIALLAKVEDTAEQAIEKAEQAEAEATYASIMAEQMEVA